MFLFFCISLIQSAAVPRFSYLIADDMSHRQCENLSKIYEDYFEEGGYKTQCKNDECKQIAKAFEDFLCVDEKDNLNHCLEEVDDDTELLIIDALKSQDTFNFQKLERKMAVQMFGIQYSSHHSSILNSIKQHNLEHGNEEMNTNLIKIDGSMRKKVSTLSVFNQGQLSITSELDVPNAFFYHCSFASKLESSQKVSLDPDTYNNLIKNKNGFKLKHLSILLPDIKSGTIRISFSNDSINFLYSNQDFPSDPHKYKSLIDESVQFISFETISIISLAKYYSLYLDDSFDPTRHKLPNFSISIDEISDTGSRKFIEILQTENVEIKTESANENAWSQFATQPHIGLSLDNTQYSINAPSSIAVDVTNPNSDTASSSNNNNNKTILIVVLTVVAVVIIIVIIVVVVIVKKKKAAKDQAIALNLSSESGRKGSLLAANEEEKLTNSDDEKAKEVEQQNNQPVHTQEDPENPQVIYSGNQSDDGDHNAPVPQYPSPYPQSTEQFPESPYGNPIQQNNTPF